ncbi:hypothetical protein HDV01_001723 [Terramyces sp. JEL0728]|nr:hypothetical protein HDV01_001723 [Terramyces sp. JEL0728]
MNQNPPAYSPPQKYIKINGITRINPAYTQWQEQTGQSPSISKEQQKTALPFVSSMNDYDQYSKVTNTEFADSTKASFEIIQDDDYCKSVGLVPDVALDEIGKLFSQYEVPLGLLSKLFEIQTFNNMEFLIDDSGSMSSGTDSRHPNGRVMTRWEEAKARVLDIFKILAYVPTPPNIFIRFLNRPDIIRIDRSSSSPQEFLNQVTRQVEQGFQRGPNGGTPFLERIRDSLNSYQNQKTIRYFFGDGVPNGGKAAIDQIVKMVSYRPNPQDNPITFVSCTGEDDDVEWMKDCEEWAPYCAECDDYQDEKEEVLGDQGLAFPFSCGFYLLSLIVGAMNPEDLDAMDESSPMTKFTLDNLLGIKYGMEEYRSYWVYFLQAQQKKMKFRWDWEPHFQAFFTAQTSACHLPVVQSYKQTALQYSSNSNPYGITRGANPYPSQPGYQQPGYQQPGYQQPGYQQPYQPTSPTPSQKRKKKFFGLF